MSTEKSASDANFKVIKKLTLPDGSRVGIINLDNILKEVAELKLTDTKTIKEELLKRVKQHNYVPRSAEQEYEAGLFEEYQQKFMPDVNKGTAQIEKHKHTPG